MLQKTEETIPRHLRRQAAAYYVSAGRASARTGGVWPSYMDARAVFMDETKSFEDLKSLFCVTTRERVRQIADELFPGVRKPEIRRLRTGKNCVQMRARRHRSALRRAARKFRKRSRIYRDLKTLCARARLPLRFVWRSGHPCERSYWLDGELTYALRITSAHRSGGNPRLYAKTSEFDRGKLAQHERLAIIVDVQGEVSVRELYLIDARQFLDAGLTYVIIPINGKHGNGGREATIDWSEHRVSTICDP